MHLLSTPKQCQLSNSFHESPVAHIVFPLRRFGLSRLPWDRPRKKGPPKEELSEHATKVVLPDPADLAAAVDDQPLRSKDEQVIDERAMQIHTKLPYEIISWSHLIASRLADCLKPRALSLHRIDSAFQICHLPGRRYCCLGTLPTLQLCTTTWHDLCSVRGW